MADDLEGLDFKSLCSKFDLMINLNKFRQAESITKHIQNKYPEQKNTYQYYKVILEYYSDRNSSIRMYDNLFLKSGLFTCEGYFFSHRVIPFEKQEIKLPEYISSNPIWCPLNPSIINTGDKYILNVRVSNYRILPGGTYLSLDQDKVIRTRNIVRELDYKFKVIDEYELHQPPEYQRNDKFGIKGLEDIRLFMYNDDLHFTSATYDTHKLNVQRVVLGKVRDKKIVNIINLDIPGQKRTTEKNWLPYVNDDKLLMVYSCQPFITLDCTNPRNIKLHSMNRCDGGYDLRQFRGSCPPIKYKDGYLFMIHQVYTKRDNSKVYVQRLVYEVNDKIRSFSHQFYFEQHEIEFCSGMCCDEEGDFVFTFGVNDIRAFIYRVKRDIVDDLVIGINVSE